MPISKHDVYHEFPEHADTIDHLVGRDQHFASLVNRYHDLNRQVQAVESDSPYGTADDADGSKRQRLHLKDKIHAKLSQHA
ncbi:MAG: YdcH family protein [Pseudomonadota bacterium]